MSYSRSSKKPRKRNTGHSVPENNLLNFAQNIHNPSMRQIDSAVIWLHGLGANGHDFAPIVPELRLPVELSSRFIFPHAPSIPVTINNNYVMPAWFDILEVGLERRINETQLQESVQHIYAFIDALVQDGVSSEKIILAGFSQGGAVAYEAALSCPYPLGGLICLSTYFATKDSITYSAENEQLPIFIGHGTKDTVVPESLGKQAHQVLSDKNYASTYKTYECEHGVFGQEITDIGVWISQALTKF